MTIPAAPILEVQDTSVQEALLGHPREVLVGQAADNAWGDAGLLIYTIGLESLAASRSLAALLATMSPNGQAVVMREEFADHAAWSEAGDWLERIAQDSRGGACAP
jgi:hypothetical protein